MWIPIALIVSLLIATAIIAPLADNLGKKLGKKRVSVWGLRPRTTAMLATIGSGWAIMLFTLFVLLSVVYPLRNALLYYESDRANYIRQQKAAQGELNKTRTELSRVQQSVVGLREQAQTFKANSQRSQQQARQYQEQAQDFQEKAQTAQSKFQTAQSNFQTAQRGAEAAQRTAKIAQVSARNSQAAASTAIQQQKAAQKALIGAKNSLQLVQTELGIKQKRLIAAQKKLAAAENSLGRAQSQLVTAYGQIVTAERQVVTAQKEAQRQVISAQKQVEQARNEVNSLKAQKDELQKQVGFYGNAAVKFNELSQALAFGDIGLSVDQTLAERRFDATRSPQEIARELRILADAADVETHTLLNKKATELQFNIASSVTDKSGASIQLNKEETIEFYSNVLASANQTVSARLVSAFNYPSDTPIVFARFVFIPIRTIYIARQNIAETTVDTRKSESAIFRQLQDLVEAARVNAVNNGARPPVIPDPQEPIYFFDGDTGPKMFEALREIQKFDHPVKVRVVAARDLDSAEPLQIRFIVGDQT